MIVGMDEVGRGAWAGPVVVGAVILAQPIGGLKDSKLLSARQREILADSIRGEAHAWSVGSASPQEIDEFGLTEALRLAYERAITQVAGMYDAIVIDGSYNFLRSYDVKTIVRADQTVPAVSAASIIAKVWRDRYMAELAAQHPSYGFERHVGYGTALHRAALAEQGACVLHRLSFRPIKELLQLGSRVHSGGGVAA